MAFGKNLLTNSTTSEREVLLAEKKQRELALVPEPDQRSQLDVFIGKVLQVLVSKPDTGFFVAKMGLPKGALPPKLTIKGKPWLGRNFTVTGVSKAFLEKERIGAEVECFGRWEEHPEYGIQFMAQFVNEKLPNSPEALEAFLASGKIHGLGAHYAKKIVDKWGVGAIEILDTDPLRLKEIPGVGEKRIGTIAASWKTYRSVYDIMSFMQVHGIGDAVGLRIYNALGENAVRQIEQNPYALTSVPLVGFRTSDKIARSLGVSPVAPFRISASLKFALEDAAKNEGHTALPFDELVNRASDLMELVNIKPVGEILQQALDKEQLVARELSVRMALRDRFTEKIVESKKLCVSTKGLTSTERRIASELRRLMDANKSEKVNREKMETLVNEAQGSLDESQVRAVRNSFYASVSIITGGPGTGKTHTIKTVLNVARACGLSVALTAPTGRAAKRMEESTGHKASTIHRLLAFAPDSGFKFNEENPLKFDVIIVDESSMIDVWLMSALLKAIESGCSVVLVGDVDQLPSVGAGDVLSDIIRSGKIPVSRLTKIHRQAEGSKIITNSHKIIKKQFPELCTEEENQDFVFVESAGNEQIKNEVVRVCEKLLSQGISPHEIQIITPQKGTEVGTQELNKYLRPILNSSAKDVVVSLEDGSKVKYAPGDRIMQFRNNYEIEVFNGDVGEVLEVDFEEGSILVDFDGKTIELKGAQLKDIRLAYAITIHKSQGTEHPYVIIPMTRSHQFMFSPNLLYTAVTRGKNKVYLIGERQVIYRTVGGQERDFRYTGLTEEIIKAFSEGENDALFM